MEYLLFTYPNCQKCEALKSRLQNIELEGKEYSLTQRESKFKIREYLGIIKRDVKGGIVLPSLVLTDNEQVAAAINTEEELDDWLKLKG